MKTAIYIEDGTVQLVLTPENELEKSALNSLRSDVHSDEEKVEATIFRGSFYDCRGGWIRQNRYLSHAYDYGSSDDRSLIIRRSKDVELPAPLS